MQPSVEYLFSGSEYRTPRLIGHLPGDIDKERGRFMLLQRPAGLQTAPGPACAGYPGTVQHPARREEQRRPALAAEGCGAGCCGRYARAHPNAAATPR
jgi:hypothetical protein